MGNPWSPFRRKTQQLRNLVTAVMMIRIIADATHGVLHVRQGGTENCALIISFNCWRHCYSYFTEGKTELREVKQRAPLHPACGLCSWISPGLSLSSEPLSFTSLSPQALRCYVNRPSWSRHSNPAVSLELVQFPLYPSAFREEPVRLSVWTR